MPEPKGKSFALILELPSGEEIFVSPPEYRALYTEDKVTVADILNAPGYSMYRSGPVRVYVGRTKDGRRVVVHVIETEFRRH